LLDSWRASLMICDLKTVTVGQGCGKWRERTNSCERRRRD
jgi:hypothetical protein